MSENHITDIQKKQESISFQQYILAVISTMMLLINTSMVIFSLGMDLFSITAIGYLNFTLLVSTIIVISLITGLVVSQFEFENHKLFTDAEKIKHAIQRDQRESFNPYLFNVHLFMYYCNDFIAISTLINLIIHLSIHQAKMPFFYYLLTFCVGLIFTYGLNLFRNKILNDRDELHVLKWNTFVNQYNDTHKNNQSNQQNDYLIRFFFVILSLAVIALVFLVLKNMIFFMNPEIFSHDFLEKLKILQTVVGGFSFITSVGVGYGTFLLLSSIYDDKPYLHIIFGFIMFVSSFFSFSLFIQKLSVIFVQLFAISINVQTVEIMNGIFWFVSLMLSSCFGITCFQIKMRDFELYKFNKDILKSSDFVEATKVKNPKAASSNDPENQSQQMCRIS